MNIGESNVLVNNKDIINTDNLINKDITIKDICGNATKRIVDIVAGIVGGILLIPITIFVVACNVISRENGPIFFKQQRIGKNGKVFTMYKYRTMVVGAEEILQKHIDEQTEIGKEYIANKKIKNDPRITKIGKFLRATSLDEFPQFINVIKGQMSLVGPRPYLSTEREDLGKYYPIIIKMKPGLTGPWQVSGRSNLKFKDRIALDIKYYEKRSFWKDMKMVLLTVKKVILREGAM